MEVLDEGRGDGGGYLYDLPCIVGLCVVLDLFLFVSVLWGLGNESFISPY